MKKLLSILIVLLFLTSLTINTFGMTIEEKLETLKKGTKMLTRDTQYSERFIYRYSEQPQQTRGNVKPDMEVEEEIYDEDILFEVLDYIQKMNEENPDVMVGERKEYLDSLLNQMGRIFSNVSRSPLTEESTEASYDELIDILNTIIDEVMMPQQGLEREFSRAPQEQYQATGIVKVNGNANVRSGPSSSYHVIASLSNGDRVQILEKNGNWYYIRMENDKNGYIYHSLLVLQDEVIVPDYQELDLQAVVSASIANIRRGPGTNYEVIRALRRGAQIKIIGKTGDWYFIEYYENSHAFIHCNLVTVDDDGSEQRGRISVASANIRKGPSTSYSRITTLRRGDIVTILATDGNWYRIKMEDGRTGYCHHNLINIIQDDHTDEPDQPGDDDDDDDTPVPMGRISASAVNIRTGPSTNYRIIVTLHRGDVVELLSTDSNWYKIKLSDNQEGYCFNTLIEVISEPNNDGDDDDSDQPSDNGDTDDKVEAYINVSGANVRSGPGTNNTKIATLSRGQMVQVLNDENDWSEVIIPDGRKGYIFSSLLTGVSSNSANISSGQQRIVQKALGVVGQADVIYGIDCYNSATEYGNLACAATVSAILRNSNVGYNRQILYCPYMQNYFDELGWRKIRNRMYEPGDVVFWTRRSGDRARHVGVIVERDVYGKWWAVDNSSSRKRLLKRPVIRSYYPVVLPVRRTNR
ncbi:MAG: hypothetical protein C0601_03470 [Candidatus Muiribacterium halophilum]|uniref:SH3b domain-containing protein n=1 Tax=Muiribacterium halophilum TaxID=2053465 RepID=A0A2N5ZJK5_MUIH1|nr:MAG: hypothetical protein C0601_03470 [Candidatus Muirbacterium halophilum]